MHRRSIMIRAALLALVCVGCVDATSESESASRSVSRVDVTEVEFSVTVSADANAGLVLFLVRNDGTEEHEFIVVRTDLSIGALPTNPDGSFNEDGEGVEVVHEEEDIHPGSTRGALADLEAGHYVLMCNRVEIEEDGEIESHFAMGMVTDFNVK
jgi:hypothetical protein